MAKESSRRVPVDVTKWSQKSKRSVIYELPPEEYSDISYHCWRCGALSTYTAEEQREAFEVRKAYIWQQRILCPVCWSERLRIEQAIRDCRARWTSEKRQLRGDEVFLRTWLTLLEQAPGYAARRDTAATSMLRKLLATE